jgi:hypothetical protein
MRRVAMSDPKTAPKLTPEQIKRLAEAWTDPDAVKRDVARRFGLTVSHVPVLLRRLGYAV